MVVCCIIESFKLLIFFLEKMIFIIMLVLWSIMNTAFFLIASLKIIILSDYVVICKNDFCLLCEFY